MIPISTTISETKSESLTISYAIVVKFFGLTLYKRTYQSTLVDFEPTINAVGFNTISTMSETKESGDVIYISK